MQLIRYERPELGLPSTRLGNWFRRPFWEGTAFPSLFDWDELWEDFPPSRRLAADLHEDEDAYHARFEHRTGGGEGGEESVQSYSRSLSVPDGVVAEKVNATLKDGILTVTMPKAEARKPRKIDIH